MKRSFSSELIPLYLATMLVIGGILLSVRDWQIYTHAATERRHAEYVRQHATALMLGLMDAETGQRGFLLTGKPEYLQPYHSALSRVRDEVRSLRQQLTGYSDQAQTVELEDQVKQKLSELELTISLRQTRGLAAALEVVNTDRGRAYMDEIRASLAHILNQASNSVNLETGQVSDSAARLRWFGIAALLSLFILLLLAQVTIRTASERRHQLIHQLTRRETELTEARDLLETTLHSIGDAVIATDAEGRITFLNPVAQQLTGWMQQSAINVPLHRVFRILNETTRVTVENPVDRVINTGRIVGLANHTVLLAQNGREVPIDDSAAPIRNSSGELVGTILVFRDVTERRVAERAVEQNRRELERTNSSLNQVNADLELFANAAGHDLQEPLRAVASFTQLAARKMRGDPDTLEYLGFIQTGVARMQAMIRDLLDYSRLSRLNGAALVPGGPAPDWPPAALEQLLGEALWNLQTAITESGANINTGHLPTLRVQAGQMVQLFQNLVGNAIKYRGPRTPEISISARKNDDNAWIISVQDNGIGIDMRHANEIFQVFRRLHGREEYNGTGIGLAMCKRIAEIHGGRIWVDSEPGLGSTFHLELSPSLNP